MKNIFEIKYEIKIKTNQNNEMNLSICIKDTKLCVTCFFYKNYFKKTFTNSFTLDELKEISPYFRQFNSEQEVLNEIINNTYKGKENIEGNEETSNLIILVIPVPGTQYKNIPFKLNEIIKTPEEILNEYKSIVNQYENKLKFTNINSKILIGKDLEKETLKMWISPRKRLTTKLLFSFNDIEYKYNNGFRTENPNLKETVETFHQKCDNITNILVVCKSGTEIFGGYTPSCFSCKEDYEYDNDSFLFSLTKLEKYPKNSHNNSKSIWCYKKFGPSFEYNLYFKEEKINSEIILNSLEIFQVFEDYTSYNTGMSKKSIQNLFGNPNGNQNNSKTKKESQVKVDDKNNNKPLTKNKDEKIKSEGKDNKKDEKKTTENEIK